MQPLLCPSLVGRDEPVKLLVAALRRTLEGSGGACFIVGEAGVGKSRLAAQIAAEARALGFGVLSGRAVETGSPVPFRPVAEALLAYFRHQRPPDLPDLEPFRPALGHLVPQWGRPGDRGADTSVVVMGEAALQLLRAEAADGGCLLILEDLHWADQETVALVEYLTDNVGAEPVFCLGTLRGDQPGPALSLTHSLASRRVGLVVDLPRLSAADVAAMARLCLNTERLPEDVDALVQEFADGVPFFVEELLAATIASGALVRAGDSWSVKGALGPVVPSTFADTVHARLRSFSQEQRQVLLAAAVLGRRFEVDLLPTITEQDEDEALGALHRAVAAQLLVSSAYDPRTFQFRHALTRDAVLAEILPAERETLSHRSLAAIESAYPGLPGALCELAASLAESAGAPGRAAELLLEAGWRASDRGALATAERMLDRARTLSSGQPALSSQVDRVLVDVLSLAGKTDRAFEAGERLLAASPPPEEQAMVHVRLARAAAAATRWVPAAEHIEQARGIASETSDESLAATVDAIASHVALGQNHIDDATALARSALVVAERADAFEVACEALEALGRCARLHDLDEATTLFDRAISIAERHDLPVWRIRALLERASIQLLTAGSPAPLLAARDEAAKAGALVAAATLDLQLAWWFKDQFEPDSLMEAATRCVEAARRFRLQTLHAMALAGQAYAYAERDEASPLEGKLAEALAVAPDNAELQAYGWEARATLALLREDRPGAVAALDAAMEYLRRSPLLPLPARGLWVLLRAVEDREGAAALDELTRFGAPHRIIQAYAGFAEAVLLGRTGRADEAGAAFAMADRTMAGVEWFRHHARRLVAEAALADAWGEPESWLREALTFFGDRGHDRIATSCRSLLAKAGSPVPRRSAGYAAVPAELRAAGVTARELEVLALLAEARSTREIATRLYLSPKTVERHVANLVVKTGVTGRTELVAWAARWFAAAHGDIVR